MCVCVCVCVCMISQVWPIYNMLADGWQSVFLRRAIFLRESGYLICSVVSHCSLIDYL